MKFSILTTFCTACALVCGTAAPAVAQGNLAAEVLADAARQQRFVFVLFWKQNDAAMDAVARSLGTHMAKCSSQATSIAVQVTDPAQQVLVQRFKGDRAPMPLVLAVAPNGAVTGAFQAPLTAEQVDGALVSPAMANCMRAMQDGKLVLMLVHPRNDAQPPAGAQQFLNNTHFRQRTAFVRLVSSQSAEARTLRQLGLTSQDASGCVVLMAPPSSMVGKFPLNVSGNHLAAKLHAAGKCCNDPNCKHNQ